ncbi:hypothetical protein [Microcoleus phage My-WqHQDG]|nr:hypothetical protein [Microcoleus phage My-WqHQDG]
MVIGGSGVVAVLLIYEGSVIDAYSYQGIVRVM